MEKTKLNPGLIFKSTELNFASLPRVDSHLHTSWTDGEASVEAMYNAAVENDLNTILYSEHSRKTSIDWFSSFAMEVRSLPASPCRAYVGTEVKVESFAGEIDTVPTISDICDFIMASVHRFIDDHGRTIEFNETIPDDAVELEFKLSWAVLENPLIDILGHIFGMSYRRFNINPPEDKIRALIKRAAEYGVAVEINSHYHPKPRQLLEWCCEYGADVTFGSNAHALEDVGAIMRLLANDT